EVAVAPGQPTLPRPPPISSFLATRRFLISAAHAFVTPTIDNRGEDYECVFDYNPVFVPPAIGTPDPRVIPHTNTSAANRNRILTPVDTLNPAIHEDDIARDLAGIRLAKRVLAPLASPVPPAGVNGTPRCND